MQKLTFSGDRGSVCVLGGGGGWGCSKLRLAYSWAWPTTLAAGKGRGGMFLFHLFLHFHLFYFPLSALSLSFIFSTISSVSLLSFSGRQRKMTHKGWRVIKPQHSKKKTDFLKHVGGGQVVRRCRVSYVMEDPTDVGLQLGKACYPWSR